MKPARFIPFVLAALIAGSFGFNSCKKNYERLMAVKTTSIDASTYLAKGEIIDVGDGSVEYGFCYSTGSNPGINDIKQVVGNTSSARSFQANLSSVNPGNTYYVRSYVKGSAGVVYGGVLSFFVQGGEVEYYYDDGVSDYGWYTSPDVGTLYMGNLFPVNTSGTILSVTFLLNDKSGAGNDPLSVSFFDSNHNYLGGTLSFTPYTGSWMVQSGLNIPYSGNFYAMLTINTSTLTAPTYSLAEDLNGPNVGMNLAYYYWEGGTWKLISSMGSVGNGIFLMRVTVQISGSKGTIVRELGPGPGPVQPSNIPCRASALKNPA